MSDSKIGFIYVLTSPNSDSIKIGGTDYPPMKRIKEINSTEPYRSLGPWHLLDFCQVCDWRKIENYLHYVFRNKLDREIKHQKELFRISQDQAISLLDHLDPDDIVRKPKIDRMFNDKDFFNFLIKMFKFTGLLNWLDIQGAWTFSLFPATSGGRYFTINIGSHEVAFSSVSKKKVSPAHMILMDQLILDFKEVKCWIKKHNGSFKHACYSSAMQRSISVFFSCSFENYINFFRLDGVRRATLAYWNEALTVLKESNRLSVHCRHHDWNAISWIYRNIISG